MKWVQTIAPEWSIPFSAAVPCLLVTHLAPLYPPRLWHCSAPSLPSSQALLISNHPSPLLRLTTLLFHTFPVLFLLQAMFLVHSALLSRLCTALCYGFTGHGPSTPQMMLSAHSHAFPTPCCGFFCVSTSSQISHFNSNKKYNFIQKHYTLEIPASSIHLPPSASLRK